MRGFRLFISLPSNSEVLGLFRSRDMRQYWERIFGWRGFECSHGHSPSSSADLVTASSSIAYVAEDRGNFDSHDRVLVSSPLHLSRECKMKLWCSVCAVSIFRLVIIPAGLTDPDSTWHYVRNLIWWYVIPRPIFGPPNTIARPLA